MQMQKQQRLQSNRFKEYCQYTTYIQQWKNQVKLLEKDRTAGHQQIFKVAQIQNGKISLTMYYHKQSNCQQQFQDNKINLNNLQCYKNFLFDQNEFILSIIQQGNSYVLQDYYTRISFHLRYPFIKYTLQAINKNKNKKEKFIRDQLQICKQIQFLSQKNIHLITNIQLTRQGLIIYLSYQIISFVEQQVIQRFDDEYELGHQFNIKH
ncbi:unnamed protein product [Paramecium pentaurelia]|uniref:Uncharacterized protein n=1 Tax=Paramecium pentaurelia TaxID=43138 RepID=A0A8S1XEZ8_9CILI|nr:unnamed protein product [Paramecium pentaurelia]